LSFIIIIIIIRAPTLQQLGTDIVIKFNTKKQQS